MKNFLLFAGFDPNDVSRIRGWYSYIQSYNTMDEVRNDYNKYKYKWGQIVDLDLEVIVEWTPCG